MFQEKYAQEILEPKGLTNCTWFFGPATRFKANQLLQDARKKRDEANKSSPPQPNGFGEADLSQLIDGFNKLAANPILGQFFIGNTGFAGFKPATGIDINADSGIVFHWAIQTDYVWHHPGAQFDLKLPGTEEIGPDLVSTEIATPISPGELWEIKPITHNGNSEATANDLVQLNKYLGAFNGSYLGGTSYGTRVIPFGTFDLVAQQGIPGIIYYSPQEKAPSPNLVPETSSVPSVSPETGWHLTIIGAGAGGVVTVWWTAKWFAPICGPALPVCAVVF